jgi:hypothetical protein
MEAAYSSKNVNIHPQNNPQDESLRNYNCKNPSELNKSIHNFHGIIIIIMYAYFDWFPSQLFSFYFIML